MLRAFWNLCWMLYVWIFFPVWGSDFYLCYMIHATTWEWQLYHSTPSVPGGSLPGHRIKWKNKSTETRKYFARKKLFFCNFLKITLTPKLDPFHWSVAPIKFTVLFISLEVSRQENWIWRLKTMWTYSIACLEIYSFTESRLC